jgi:hypothetical protein
LTRYTGRNRLNHLQALSNFFRFASKMGAIGSVPTADIDISFRRSGVCYLESNVFAELLTKARDQNQGDILVWLVLWGFLGLRPFEAYRAAWSGVKWETSLANFVLKLTDPRHVGAVFCQSNRTQWNGFASPATYAEERIRSRLREIFWLPTNL